MRPFTWHSACELLKKGAVIEVVQWKTIQPYIRLESEDVFEKVKTEELNQRLRQFCAECPRGCQHNRSKDLFFVPKPKVSSLLNVIF